MSNSKKAGGSRPTAKSSEKSGSSSKKSAKVDSAIRGARNSSVVSKSGRPWALIGATLAVVLFAAFAVFYAVKATSDKTAKDAANDPTKISGLQTFDYTSAQGAHSNDPVTYKETPPVGGTHNPEWADCTGTVYSVQIKNENAVHSLEHGAVWITYDPALVDADVIAQLEKLASGKDFTLLSPYPNQGSPISLQSWGHQLKVDSPTDKRVKKFIDGFRLNAEFTPELGASCQNPTFKADPKVPSDTGVPDQSAPMDPTSTGTQG
ncbi:uncharacterized protein DUF3105 [Antricoccus suffuscus]|uniref:Uncharacterized protein DUF3105 n=1 Tax=Antricoccus suffuscus TaxID=1629062 RepID=A0A2T1A4E6_9ACTN|nr:DUF3105 domain-containing protein [Antricoccus suffuscus]PRZ43377.1 uncharacterized protein DUF3105 [Antricoccus suffuscus]